MGRTEFAVDSLQAQLKKIQDAGRFLTTVNPSTENCFLNHEEHEEKEGEHEASSAFKLFGD